MIFMEEGAKSAFGAKAVDDPHGFQDSPLDSPARTPGTRTPVLVRKQSDVPLPARIDTAALLVTVETSIGDQKMTIAEAIKTRPPAAYMDAFKDTMPLPAPRLHTAPAGARRPIAQPTPAMPTKQPTVKVVPTARFAGGASYLPGPPKPKLVPPDFDSADGQKTKPPVVLPLGLKFLYPPQPGSYSARERQPPAQLDRLESRRRGRLLGRRPRAARDRRRQQGLPNRKPRPPWRLEPMVLPQRQRRPRCLYQGRRRSRGVSSRIGRCQIGCRRLHRSSNHYRRRSCSRRWRLGMC